MKVNGIVVECPLCEERSLHMIGPNEDSTLQCISCGMASSHAFLGTPEENENYKKYGENALSFSENFNWNKIVKKYLNLI